MNLALTLYPMGGMILLFSLFYVIARIRDDYSIIDVCWGLGFAFLASFILLVFEAAQGSPPTQIHLMITALVWLWALRLSGYILYRNLNKGEDERYRNWREEWGDNAPIKFFIRVYMLQAVLCMMVASGLWVTLAETNLTWAWNTWVGLSLSLFAFFYEAIADYQKDQFKKKEENRGKPCREGLWYYSRHPNYFGEMLFWWGIFLFSLNTNHLYYTWVGPALLVFFLIKVSGIPMLKEKHQQNPNYHDYLESTNALIPWPPKK